MISLLAVQAICNSKDPAIETIYPFLTAALESNNIDTPLRTAMFIAQTAHESMGYRQLEELASGQAYENRADLGNTTSGDGVKYKGRGIIQITGKGNYSRMSQAIFANSLLLDYPERLSEPELAAQSGGLFWSWKALNRASDAGDVLAVTKKINGGTCGLVERLALYKRACYALGIAA